jgi:hypothetical protein
MKKKTRRRLKKAWRQLGNAVAPTNGGGTVLGAFALGGLLAALAKDEDIRAQARTLAGTTLQRLVQLVSGPLAPASHGDTEDAHEERGLKHAH